MEAKRKKLKENKFVRKTRKREKHRHSSKKHHRLYHNGKKRRAKRKAPENPKGSRNKQKRKTKSQAGTKKVDLNATNS